MAFGSGTFTRLWNFLTERVNNQKIFLARLDDELDGMATALTQLHQGTTAAETTIASAGTTDLSTADGMKVLVTGTTTITSFGTGAELLRIVRFSGALTLTHNATSLILPGGVNIVTEDGDVAILISDASGNWRLVSYLAEGPFWG
jgi:hypothetical protein